MSDRRLLAQALASEGRTVSEIAHTLEAPRSTIYWWLFGRRSAPGRRCVPPEVAQARAHELHRKLLTGPVAPYRLACLIYGDHPDDAGELRGLLRAPVGDDAPMDGATGPMRTAMRTTGFRTEA